MMRRLPATLRWGACFAMALGLHVGGAAALMARWSEHADQLASAPVIMLDLAPVAVAPQATPTELPPDLVQSDQQDGAKPTPDKPKDVVEPQPQPEPDKPVEVAKAQPAPEVEKPVEAPELKPEPTTDSELSILPPPRPSEKKVEDKPQEKKKEVKKKPPQRQASLAAAPSPAEHVAERAAAPTQGAARDSDALPNWTSRLIAQIQRHKRYPPDAQARGDRGVVRLAFSVDRSGGVHNARVLSSSGSGLLDREALALIERAAPLPPPPDEVHGARIPISVPINYSIR